MSPARFREWILVLTRDLLPPVTGALLAFGAFTPFQAWQLPLIAGLFGVPLVAPRGSRDDS